MGRLLDALRVDSGNGPAANPANVANLPKGPRPRFADSQDSQGLEVSKPLPATDADAIRHKLLTLAADEQVPAAVVHCLHGDDLAACAGCTDTELRAYVRALGKSAAMDAGRVPASFTVATRCPECGPVWLSEAHPPEAKSCPWCFRRRAGKAVPRP